MKRRKRTSVLNGITNRLNYLDMFGKSFKKSDLKNIKFCGILTQVVAVLFCLLLVFIFFNFTPDHFKVVLPEESDLSKGPSLRASSNIIESHTIRRRVVELLEEHCSLHSDYDILFCHNVHMNSKPIYSPCFMVCETKTFYYNLEVVRTDEVRKLNCFESYSTIEQKRVRDEIVLIRGQKGVELERFSMIPNTTLSSCLLQHANELSRGEWLQ